jgi:putative endonuclease
VVLAIVADRGEPSARRFAMTTTARQRSTLGAYGEALAARHLVGQGMVLLDRNWRCRLGEVDLVLRDGPVLVICEVKTRSSLAFGSPLEGVTERKAARLRRLAGCWIADHQMHPREVRIDAVGVLVPPSGPVEVDHVRGLA